MTKIQWHLKTTIISQENIDQLISTSFTLPGEVTRQKRLSEIIRLCELNIKSRGGW